MAGGSSEKGKTKVIFVKKKAKGHGHHGGAWKVAYADFVTAMMALFLVLWLVSQTDETTRAALAHYFRTGVFSGTAHSIGEALPEMTGSRVPGGRQEVSTEREGDTQDLEHERELMEEQLQQMVQDHPELEALREQVDVQVTDEGLLIQIVDGGEDLFFDLSSASIKRNLEVFLQQLAPLLARLPNDLQIHGHTDARPFPPGSTRTNWNLSFDRADAARVLMERNGLRESQVVGVIAHGASALLVPDEPMADANRRLSILAVRRGAESRASRGDAEAGFAPPVAPPIDTQAP